MAEQIVPRSADKKRFKRLLAAVIGECVVCGEREPKVQLHRVPAENMTFLEGMELCSPCARKHGVA